MQIELSKIELELLRRWGRYVSEACGTHQDDDDLYVRIVEELAAAEELESIDLNECTGGACTL